MIECVAATHKHVEKHALKFESKLNPPEWTLLFFWLYFINAADGVSCHLWTSIEAAAQPSHGVSVGTNLITLKFNWCILVISDWRLSFFLLTLQNLISLFFLFMRFWGPPGPGPSCFGLCTDRAWPRLIHFYCNYMKWRVISFDFKMLLVNIYGKQMQLWCGPCSFSRICLQEKVICHGWLLSSLPTFAIKISLVYIYGKQMQPWCGPSSFSRICFQDLTLFMCVWYMHMEWEKAIVSSIIYTRWSCVVNMYPRQKIYM